jgi:hypothetical protein
MDGDIMARNRPNVGAVGSVGSRTACGGLFRRKEVWALSLRGWLVVFVVATGLLATVFYGSAPFLSVTDRVDAPVLVVEGWLPDYALLDGWKEFKAGRYKQLFTVGTPMLAGLGIDPGDNYASWAAHRLQMMVGQHKEITAVPAFEAQRDRTYAGAVALREWLQSRRETVQAINVLTLSVHARRSRLLYQKAFGPDVAVGIVAVNSQEYDARRWWKYSDGVKEMTSEGAAYLYARIFFHPGS